MADCRVCVIGNSHVGAIKHAWQRLERRHQGYELTFFAASRNRLKHLEPEGECLVPRHGDDVLREQLRLSSGGIDTIRLPDYDACLFVGLEINFHPVFEFYRAHRVHEHLAGSSRNLHLVSLPLLRQSIDDVLGTQWGFRLIESATSRAGGALCIAHHSPMPTRRILVAETPFAKKASQALRSLADEDVLGFLVSECMRGFGAHCSTIGVVPLTQPPDTLEQSGFTREEYLIRGAADSSGATGSDYYHMNVEYGRKVLDSLLPLLAGVREPSAGSRAR